jgi:hypothetical protein
MHRVTRATLGTVAIGLVAVFLVAGMVGGGLLGALHMPGQTAKSSPVGSAGKNAAPLTAAARTYLTTIDLQFNTTGGAPAFPSDTWVPYTFSFYANVTYGSIDNTNTKAWVVVYDEASSSVLATYTLNGTITAANVVKNYNNGVWFENYTWFSTLDKTTLGCATASCADLIPATNDLFAITVYMTENGASMGGGPASTSVMSETNLVSTFASAGFLSPASFLVPIPAAVEFYTNISWGYTYNASIAVSLEASIPALALDLNFSFDGIVNATNSNGFSSVSGFNGTAGGVPYSYTTWMMTLNNTTIGCLAGSSPGCNLTLTDGVLADLNIWVDVKAADAGGLADTGTQLASYAEVALGSTLINAGAFGAPLAYQPLPYTATGWLNESWVSPLATAGNASVKGGYVLIWDTVTDTYLGSLSLNNSVNTTNANGVSLMVVFNGTVAGVPYVNFTWSWSLDAVAGSLGANVPYDDLLLLVDAYANGNGSGGWDVSTGLMPAVEATFVEYPTTVSAAFTSTFSAYMPLPIVVNFTIAVGNAPITAATTSIVVDVTDLSLATSHHPTGALITSTTITPADNQTAYTFTVDSSTLACNTASCSTLPADSYGVYVYLAVDGTSLPTNGSVATDRISASFFLLTTPLSASLVSPASGASVPVGNVTVSVAYLGSYVAGAVLNIYSSTGSLVFSKSMIELIPGVPVNGTWFVGQGGVYPYSIVMTTTYLVHNSVTHYFNGTISVISKGGTVYQNSTSYSNQSAISGLSGAAAGTLLLVIGLIIGMIVALVLARAVMGRPATAPPQPWESKPGGTGAAAPNTCSVCNKSFSTPEELAAHGKSEHGMQ